MGNLFSNVLIYIKSKIWIIIVLVILIVTLGSELIFNLQGKNYQNIYDVMDNISKIDEIIIRKTGNGATIINGESLNDIINSSDKGINDWQEGKSSLVKGVTPTLQVYINYEGVDYISFYESNKEVATISIDGKSRNYRIPNRIYEKIDALYLSRSYYIPEELVKTITDGKKTSKVSVHDSPINVDYNTVSVGSSTYYIYKEKSKYYIEMPYVFINEISEDIYNDAAMFVSDESIAKECEEKNNDDIIIEVSESTKFSKAEINEAIECVKNNFSFPACKLDGVMYEEEKSNYLIDSYMETGGAEGRLNAENIIVLLSSFYVDGSGDNPVLNPNTKYEDYQWLLIRDNKMSQWRIESFGY